ncbi:MAG: phosphonate C-P lyase system protein PhnG [Treponema sp.]|jgi:alpha-D-ribose 1-methylphosphonate 5-triphosphate synthase subunit PhnG|nr:phosphonate C-P lyase system protein PhnG [Treponema sp.]
MDKIALSRITAFADPALLQSLAERAAAGKEALILKGPEKTMILIQIKEPVRQDRFYLGEALAAHCVVELGGVRGAAVQLGDDLRRAEASAILDAAHSGGFAGFSRIEEELLHIDEERKRCLAREAALARETQVAFHVLEDREL